MAEKRTYSTGDQNVVVPLRPETATSPEGLAALPAMLAEHDRLQSLCDVLEQIADDLPKAPPPLLCRELISAIAQSHSPKAQACSKVLAHTLQGPWSGLGARIAAMQAEQEGLGQEIILSLEHISRSPQVDAPDMLGYMLRAWFEGCKRLMMIEELALLACSRQHLTARQSVELEIRLN